MKFLVMSLAVLLLSLPLLAEEPPPDEAQLLAAIQRAPWGSEERHDLAGEFLSRFPDSDQVTKVLRAWLDGARFAKRQEALDLLRRAEDEHPAWRRNLGALYAGIVERLAGWSFTPVPASIHPPSFPRLHSPFRDGPGARTFRLFFVPDEARRRALLAADPDSAINLLPPREEWREIASWAGGSRQQPDWLTKPGTYVVEEEVVGLTKTSVLVARDWFLLVHSAGGDGVAWVFDVRGRECPEGVKITVRQAGGTTEGTTGPGGTFRFRRTSSAIVVAERAGEVEGASLWFDPPEEADETRPIVHVTTDRPIYRPGQEVRFRALRRDLAAGELSPPAPVAVRVGLYDPGGRLIADRTETWDADGVIAGSFPLAPEPPLGQWTVVVGVRDPWYREYPGEWDLPERVTGQWRRHFRVEEYRKPEIRVGFEAAPPAEDGRPRGRIRVEYYTGEPVAGADVEWSAEARYEEEESDPELRADPRGWFFLRPPLFWSEWDERESWGYADAGDGEGETGPDGTLLVDLLAEDEHVDPEAREAGVFRIRAFVRGLSGTGTEATGTVPRSGFGDRVSLEVPATWVPDGGEIAGRAVVRDRDGGPAAGRKVEVAALRAADRAGALEYEEVERREVVTGEDGTAPFSFAAKGVAGIRVLARCATAAAAARHDVMVASGRAADLPWRAGGEAEPFEVLPDRVVYEPGETARILVRTGRDWYWAVGLLVVEAEGIRTARAVRFDNGVSTFEIPITEDLAPNAIVTLLAATREKLHVVRREILVYPRERVLSVVVAPERAEYAPGDRVRIRVETRDAGGAPAPSLVELAVADASLFALAEDRTEDVRSFFFPLRRPDSDTEPPPLDVDGSLRAWRKDFEEWQGRAIFGAVEEEGPGAREAAVRRRFADTMLYDARVRTGADGTATVEVEAPGDLAEWRILARAVSGADRFGVATSKTVTRKDVTVRIAAPRFFTVGDEGRLGTVVRNDLPHETELAVSLAAEGLEAGGEPRRVTVPAGGEVRLDWAFRAVAAGSARIRASATGGDMSDSVAIEVLVRPHGSRQQVTAAGRVDGKWRASLVLPAGADPAAARLEVRAAGIAPGLAGALPFLAGYPYGCVEQTMSRFLPSVAVARALSRLGMEDPALEAELPKMVRAGLLRLYRFQHDDGGWGWWEHDATDPFMTAWVVSGLCTARAAGFEVDERTMHRAVEALSGTEAERPTAFGRHALVLAGADVSALPEVEPETVEDRAWLTLAGARGLLDDYRPPEEGDTGASVAEVALVLRALDAEAPESPRIGDLAEWLLAHRRGAAWFSTLDSAQAILALAEVAGPPGAVTARVRVNGVDCGAGGVVPAGAVRAGANEIEVERHGEGPLFASAALSFLDSAAEGLAAMPGRFAVAREIRRVVVDEDKERDWVPLGENESVRVGEELLVVVTVDAPEGSEYVMVEAPLPAGTEAWPAEEDEEWWWDSWYQQRELRDDRVSVAARRLEGRESFEFRLRATVPGTYHVMPARAFSMYEPELAGRSSEIVLRISD